MDVPVLLSAGALGVAIIGALVAVVKLPTEIRNQATKTTLEVNEDLRDEVKALRERNRELAEENETLRDDLATMEQQVKKLRSDVDSLEQKLAAVRGKAAGRRSSRDEV